MINIVGLGYIGLPTALMFAASGLEVVGTDLNGALINDLIAGKVTIDEDGLEELYARAVEHGILFSTTLRSVDTYIIAVPTPYDKSSKKIDPSYVIAALQSVLAVCNKGAVIILESTVSPGTIDKYIRPVIEAGGLIIGQDIHLVHAPERIIPGNMVHELVHNSRTIGADSVEIAEQVKKLYSAFCKGEIVTTSIRTAEMTKVVENTYRDINIAFANELAKICRSDNMDVYDIIRIANKHPRVNIMQPGPGVGGHCISVDPWFLVGDYPGLANIVLAARKINDDMPRFVLGRINEIMKANDFKDVGRIGLYGLTYKENVSDIRESPTLQMLEKMEEALSGGLVQVYDPHVKSKIVPNQHFNLDEFLEAVDMVVIMVGHDEIKDNMKKLAKKLVLDTRNICQLPGVYRL